MHRQAPRTVAAGREHEFRLESRRFRLGQRGGAALPSVSVRSFSVLTDSASSPRRWHTLRERESGPHRRPDDQSAKRRQRRAAPSTMPQSSCSARARHPGAPSSAGPSDRVVGPSSQPVSLSLSLSSASSHDQTAAHDSRGAVGPFELSLLSFFFPFGKTLKVGTQKSDAIFSTSDFRSAELSGKRQTVEFVRADGIAAVATN